MSLKPKLLAFFVLCISLSTQSNADTVTKGLEQTARDVGNGVVGLLNAFGSGKLKPDNIELLSDSTVALSFNGQRFNNPCGIEVFWGDGSSEKFRVEKDAYKTGFTLEHQYDSPQDYKIEINGKVIFRGLKTVVNCPGNFEGTIALANQTPASSAQPPQDQTTQVLSAQSEETLANAEKIRALEAEVAKKQAERIAELEAQLEAQANDEKIKKLEKELAEKQAKRIAELEAQLKAQENTEKIQKLNKGLAEKQAEKISALEGQLRDNSKNGQGITNSQLSAESASYESDREWVRNNRSTKPDEELGFFPEERGYCKDFRKGFSMSLGFEGSENTKKGKLLIEAVSTDLWSSLETTPYHVDCGYVYNPSRKNEVQHQISVQQAYFEACRASIYSNISRYEKTLLPGTKFTPSSQLLMCQGRLPLEKYWYEHSKLGQKTLWEMVWIGQYEDGALGLNQLVSKANSLNYENSFQIAYELSVLSETVANDFVAGVKAGNISSNNGQLEFMEQGRGERRSAGLTREQQEKLDQADAIIRNQAYVNYMAEQRKRNDQLADEIQQILQKGLGGIGNQVKEDSWDQYKKNRQKECRYQGKLYSMGKCR